MWFRRFKLGGFELPFVLVTHRVSNSRFRVRHVFQLPGLGSGPVFVNFQSRVRVLPCQVSGFCRVSNLPKKEAYFGGKSEFFLVVKNFRIFFSTFMNNSLEKWIQSGLKIGNCVNALDFFRLYWFKMPDFPKKLAILVLTKTLRVLSGFKFS